MSVDLTHVDALILHGCEDFIDQRFADFLFLHRSKGIGEVGFGKTDFLSCSKSHTGSVFAGLFDFFEGQLLHTFGIGIVVGVAEQVDRMVAGDEFIRLCRHNHS